MLLNFAAAFQAIRTRSKNQFRVEKFRSGAAEPTRVVRRPEQGSEVLALEHGPAGRVFAEERRGIEEPAEPAVNVMKLFSPSSLNKLERLSMPSKLAITCH